MSEEKMVERLAKGFGVSPAQVKIDQRARHLYQNVYIETGDQRGFVSGIKTGKLVVACPNIKELEGTFILCFTEDAFEKESALNIKGKQGFPVRVETACQKASSIFVELINGVMVKIK